MNEQGAQTAGVIARPPLLFLGAIVLGLVADWLFGWSLPATAIGSLRWPIAGVLVLLGVALMTAGIRNFSRAGTPVPTNVRTRVLVTSGIHARSRNPIYVGMFLIYIGIGLAARSPSILAFFVPLAIVMRYGVVAREEAYLERCFGDEYRDYKRRVRRWL